MVQAATPTVGEHDIELQFAQGAAEVKIIDRLLLSGRDSYRFRLAPWIDIERIELDGQEVHAVRPGANDYLLSLPGDEPHRIEFSLRGMVPRRNGQQAAPGVFSSAGEDGIFLPAYDDWIPTDSTGLMRYRLRVTVPPGQRAIATGKLVEEQITDQHYQASFLQEFAAEAPSLFIGPYRVRERYFEGLRLRTYFHAELEPLADSYLDAAATFLGRYNAQIGDYPYADFHVISAPLPVGLGFPNLTYVGRQVIPLPFMRSRSLAHEVLHNWWGNGVSIDYASGNWAEGLTTYMADYALQRDQGEVAARSMRVKWLRDYTALPVQRDQAVRNFKSKQHQASQVIGYNKVAFIFHMLELEIGAEAFAKGLSRFWQRHRYSTAGWRHLQAAFEQASGDDLGWFFRQWVERSGAPRPSLGAHSVEQVDAGYRTRIEIIQPVTDYRFKLPVILATDAGERRYQLTIEETRTQVEFITPEKPRYLHFDPDSDLFRRLDQSETPPIIRDVTLDSTALTVIYDDDDGFKHEAQQLASRLLESEPKLLESSALATVSGTLLLITRKQNLSNALAQLQLEPPADLPALDNAATVWTARRSNRKAVMVVAVENLDELKALLRPLPHYGGQSYVLFSAGRALQRGIWPVQRGSLYRSLDAGS